MSEAREEGMKKEWERLLKEKDKPITIDKGHDQPIYNEKKKPKPA